MEMGDKMVLPIVMTILVGACFAAVVLNVAVDSRVRRAVLSISIIIAVVTGAVFYGYGFAWAQGMSAASLFRALLAMCRMMVGINDYSAIAECPLLVSTLGKSLFWLGHFCGFYVTANAAITMLGERLLRRIRVTLLRRGPLLLIYGVNDDSTAYGKDMAAQKKRSVLFVDPDGSTSFEGTVKAMGAVIEKSDDALIPNRHFLREVHIRAGSRALELAALHTDGRKNLEYAKALLKVMDEAGIRPEQTSLIISGAGDQASSLQAAEGRSGYGSVFAFDEYELAARLVIRDFPPCGRISFDGQGRAEEDFRAVILGYGRMGRAMLSQLVCNGQFYGSHFRADIFDPDPQNGFLHGQRLTEFYDIRFHPEGGKADGFYRFLEQEHESIRCVVLCTGNADDNREIAEDLAGWYALHPEWRRPVILQASRGCYYGLDEDGSFKACTNIYNGDILDIEKIDAMAMQIHHMYTGSAQNASADWKNCDYFSRMSSRASADFYPAVLRAAGRTAGDVLSGSWPPDEETLENLAVTEHMRWCAFHHVCGFVPMPQEIWEQRARACTELKQSSPGEKYSIGKDVKNRLHACLVPWEELDALSDRENAVTGGSVNYKQMDRNNVLAVSDVLRAMSAAEKSRQV